MRKFFTCASFLCAISSAVAAPLPSSTHLPINEADLDRLQEEYGMSEKAVKSFLEVLNRVEVYPDHTNPSRQSEMDNKELTKIFYAAPFLSPSEDESVVGAQEINHYALEILDYVDTLGRSLNFEANRFKEVSAKLSTLNSRYVELVDDGVALLDPRMQSLQGQIASAKEELDDLKQKAAEKTGRIGGAIREQFINSIVMELNRIGIQPSKQTSQMLYSDDTHKFVQGFAELRSLASSGQMAIRQTTLLSGLSESENKVLSIYHTIRPDIRFKKLDITSTYVKPAAQTAVRRKKSGRPETDGSYELVEGAYMIRAINGADGGKCGGRSSCNVVIEYTESGARSFLLSRSTATVMPVTFEGDVSFKEPDFKGSIDCSYSILEQEKGRVDIITTPAGLYDGDIYSKLRYDSKKDGGCDYHIEKGSKDSAVYHTMERIYSQFLSTYAVRSQQSSTEIRNRKNNMDEYVFQRSEQQRRRRDAAAHNLLTSASTWTSWGGSRCQYRTIRG